MKLRLACCTSIIVAASTLTPQIGAAADLSEIYQIAVSKDSVIQASRAQYEAAIAALPLARSAIRPQLALSADSVLNDVNDDLSGNFGTASLTASVSQALYNPTATRSVKKAKVSVAQAEATLKEAEQTLMSVSYTHLTLPTIYSV